MFAVLLALFERFCSNVLALASRLPPLVWAVLVLGGWAWHWQAVAHKATAQVAQQAAALAKAQAAVTATQQARATEQALHIQNQKVSDELYQTQQALGAATRSSAQRLRDLANAKHDNATTTAALTECRRYAGPAVNVIPDSTRDALVDLAHDADAVTAQLRACQSYITDVVKPQP